MKPGQGQLLGMFLYAAFGLYAIVGSIVVMLGWIPGWLAWSGVIPFVLVLIFVKVGGE